MDSTAIYHYAAIFVMLVAAGIGAPIPEEIPVVTGGLLVGHPDNNLRWWIMLPVCIAGVVISDGILYGVGRWWGPRLLEYRWIKERWLPPARLTEIEGNFHKYGVKILLFARVLPGIRAPIFITAGIMRLPFALFLLADGIYAIPGVSLLFFLGFWFTDQFLEIVHKVESIRPLIAVVALTAVGTWLLIRFFRKPVTTGAPEELPPIVTTVSQFAGKAMETLVAEPTPDGRGLPLPAETPKKDAAATVAGEVTSKSEDREMKNGK